MAVHKKINFQQFKRFLLKEFDDIASYKTILQKFKKLGIGRLYGGAGYKKALRKFKELFGTIFSWERCDKRAKRIFISYSYLNCYNFYNCVRKLNGNEEYFRDKRVPAGEFEWVEEDLRKIYSDSDIVEIGIPLSTS